MRWCLCPWTSRLCCLAGKLDEVYSKLVDANPNMMVYKKESIPARFHYQHNSRIMPILLEAKEGWTIMQNRSENFMCKYISLAINVDSFFISLFSINSLPGDFC